MGYKRIQRKKRITPEERERLYSAQHLRNAERIYALATRMQGLLIKMCQFISSRADVAPPEYVAVLSALQDQVPSRPYPEIRAEIRSQLGEDPAVIFEEFATTPIASASLAQVHRARLRILTNLADAGYMTAEEARAAGRQPLRIALNTQAGRGARRRRG